MRASSGKSSKSVGVRAIQSETHRGPRGQDSRMERRPLIGLTTSEIRHPDPAELIPHADAGREEVVLGSGYFRALAGGGGAPVVMPPLDPALAPSYLAGLAGVCLSGGPHVDPGADGADPHPKLGETQPR